jgi:hypothetical protein
VAQLTPAGPAAAISMLFWIAGDLFGAPRALFAFGRDGFLPAALGRLHPTTKVPHVAILVHTAIAFVLAVTGTFEQLAILAALASTILYALACAAAWRLRRMDVAVLGDPPRMPGLPLAAVIGIAHPKWAERPLLVVVAAPGRTPTRADLLAFLEGKIARWWMPDDVRVLDGLPHTAAGKIDKLGLRALLKDYRWPTAIAAAPTAP